jgi:hypothetical protein
MPVHSFPTRRSSDLVTLSGKSWLQQTAFHLGGKKTMADVTLSIRNALEKKE